MPVMPKFLLSGDDASSASALLQSSGLLDQLADGYALVDLDERVLWGNSALRRLVGGEAAIEGRKFFDLFGVPKILAPVFEPFNTALATNVTTRGMFLVGEKTYYELQVTPVFEQSTDCPTALIAVTRDVTAEVSERDRMKAIYQAGL